jgi:hypothetical protein
MSWLTDYLAERRRERPPDSPFPNPVYHDRFDPVHPCRIMGTRHCPEVYEGVCGDRPCARFESDDETPWLAEI